MVWHIDAIPTHSNCSSNVRWREGRRKIVLTPTERHRELRRTISSFPRYCKSILVCTSFALSLSYTVFYLYGYGYDLCRMCMEFMRNVHKTQSGRRTGIRYNDRYAEDFVHARINRGIDQVFYKILGGLCSSNICEERTLFSKKIYLNVWIRHQYNMCMYFLHRKNRRNFIF